MTHEAELSRLTDNAADAVAETGRLRAIDDDAGDRELPLKAFAARFIEDGGGKAPGFGIERGIGHRGVYHCRERTIIAARTVCAGNLLPLLGQRLDDLFRRTENG